MEHWQNILRQGAEIGILPHMIWQVSIKEWRAIFNQNVLFKKSDFEKLYEKYGDL